MTLHLVRRREPPAGAIAPGDRVLHDRDGAWHDGAAPIPDAALVELLFAAARVAVW